MVWCSRHRYDGIFDCPDCLKATRQFLASRVAYCRYRLREIDTDQAAVTRAYDEAMEIEDTNALREMRERYEVKVEQHEVDHPTHGARMAGVLQKAGFRVGERER